MVWVMDFILLHTHWPALQEGVIEFVSRKEENGKTLIEQLRHERDRWGSEWGTHLKAEGEFEGDYRIEIKANTLFLESMGQGESKWEAGTHDYMNLPITGDSGS